MTKRSNINFDGTRMKDKPKKKGLLVKRFLFLGVVIGVWFGVPYKIMALFSSVGKDIESPQTTAAYQPFERFKECDVCSEMIVLPAGKYMMGSTAKELQEYNEFDPLTYLNEVPWRHEEQIKTFALAKFNITRKQFSVFAHETRFTGKGCRIFDGTQWMTSPDADWQNPGIQQTDDDPVVCVSWKDTQKFIAWLNTKVSNSSGRQYRLPTSAEWEYAARAGTVTAAYWGNNPTNSCEYENTRDIVKAKVDPRPNIPYVNCVTGYVTTAPVGSFKPNPWGFYDMLGNAEQWVSDCGGASLTRMLPYLSEVPKLKAISCSNRIIRGNSWTGIPVGTRAAGEGGAKINNRDNVTGFRLAITNYSEY